MKAIIGMVSVCGVLAEAVQELPVQVAQAEEEKAGHVVDDVLLREGGGGSKRCRSSLF